MDFDEAACIGAAFRRRRLALALAVPLSGLADLASTGTLIAITRREAAPHPASCFAHDGRPMLERRPASPCWRSVAGAASEHQVSMSVLGRETSTLSMRRPSRSITSNLRRPRSKHSPTAGRRFNVLSTSPATVS